MRIKASTIAKSLTDQEITLMDQVQGKMEDDDPKKWHGLENLLVLRAKEAQLATKLNLLEAEIYTEPIIYEPERCLLPPQLKQLCDEANFFED